MMMRGHRDDDEKPQRAVCPPQTDTRTCSRCDEWSLKESTGGSVAFVVGRYSNQLSKLPRLEASVDKDRAGVLCPQKGRKVWSTISLNDDV